MKTIDREMKTKDIVTNKSNSLCYCQASFNSSGNITLRNYDIHNKNSDEIIILSQKETKAIVKLFSEIGRIIKTDELPF